MIHIVQKAMNDVFRPNFQIPGRSALDCYRGIIRCEEVGNIHTAYFQKSKAKVQKIIISKKSCQLFPSKTKLY